MYPERWSNLFDLLDDQDLAAAAVIPGPNLAYLTGLRFHLMERPVVGLFARGRRPHLVLPALEQEKARASGLDLALFPYGEDEASRQAAFHDAARAFGLGEGALAVEPTRMRFLEQALLEACAQGVQCVDGEAALGRLRVLKSDEEVGWMSEAVRIAEKALDAVVPQIRIGMSEGELAGELTLQLLRGGSDVDLPFSPIVASGPNSALPHATPSDRPLQAGDLLIIDWGASVHGYFSDLTRTLAVGEVDPELAKIHAIVADANEAGRGAAKPGAACGDVDRAARSVIDDAGYGTFFMHRTGHGLGLEEHEAPYIRADNPDQLANGMTFTVEPGIYLPGRGGVRIEDDVVVRMEGARSLSGFQRALLTVG